MPGDEDDNYHHYSVLLKMYGTMMLDLATCESYIRYMIAGHGLDAFETTLRTQIEKSPKL